MWGGGRGSGIFQRRAIFVLSRPNLANLGFSSLLPDSATAMHNLGFVPEAHPLFEMICISESEIAPRFGHEVFSRLATPHRSARHNSHEAHDDFLDHWGDPRPGYDIFISITGNELSMVAGC